MPHKMFVFMQGVMEDLRGKDRIFIYELADAVRTLAVDHNVATQGQANRTLICILACKSYASCPIPQRERTARSSWDRLTVLEKMELKKAVRIPRCALRVKTLLNLAGVEEKAPPILWKDDTTQHVSRATGMGFDHEVSGDSVASITWSRANGARVTKHLSL